MDINYSNDLDNADRYASGSVQVLDYEGLIGAAASGTIEVLDYTELLGVKATGTITITAYASLSGKTVTVNGSALVEGSDFTAGTSNNATATSLASAINGVSGVAASAVGAVITITADNYGVAGNLIGMSTDATAGITIPEAHLLGGKEHGTVTVGSDVLVEGSDFTAETDEATTALNIKNAIDALTDYVATVDDVTITITAAAVGEAGNVELSVTPEIAVTLSGDTLEGGVDEGVINFGGTELVQGADFNAETSNAVTATNIASAIDGIAGFSASVDGGDNTLVNIDADSAGLAGNVDITTNKSDALTIVTMSGGADYWYSDILEYDTIENSSITITPKVVTLTGNAFGTGTVTVVDYSALSGKTVTVGAVTLTEGVDWTAATSNNATATSLKNAINALPLVNASVVGAVVTITAASAGAAGNLALSTNGGSDLTVSGATLTGGADATVSVAVEVSYSKHSDDWEEIYTFTDFTATGSRTKTLTKVKSFARVRFSVTNATASVEVRGQASEYGGEGDEIEESEGEATEATLQDILTEVTQINADLPPVESSGADAITNTSDRVKTSARLSAFNGTTWDRLRTATVAVTSTLTGFLNTLPWAVFNATPTTRTEGQGGTLQASNLGKLLVQNSADSAIMPSSTTMQNSATGNGNGTSLNVQGFAIAILNIVSSVAMSGGTTVNFEASVDDTTWVPIVAHQVGAIGTQATSTTIDGDYRISVAAYKSVRARISGYSAGTVTIKGYVTPTSGQATAIGISGGNVASLGTDQGNPVKVGWVYNTSAPSPTNGQRVDAQSDSKGNLQVNLNTRISGENQGKNRLMTTRPGTSTRITTATTATPVSGTGILAKIIVEVALTGTVTAYDNTAASGTIVTILPIGTPAGVYMLDIALTTGLTIVTSAADRIVVVADDN